LEPQNVLNIETLIGYPKQLGMSETNIPETILNKGEPQEIHENRNIRKNI
jgi:hypothetical protein